MGKHAKGQKHIPHARKKKAGWRKKTLRVLGVIFLILVIMAIVGNFIPNQDSRAATRPAPARQSQITTCTHTVVYSVDHGVMKLDKAHKVSDTLTCKTGGN